MEQSGVVTRRTLQTEGGVWEEGAYQLVSRMTRASFWQRKHNRRKKTKRKGGGGVALYVQIQGHMQLYQD